MIRDTERYWVFEPVKYDKKEFALVGKPDYAVRYGNVDDTAVNIVVVEARPATLRITEFRSALHIWDSRYYIPRESQKKLTWCPCKPAYTEAAISPRTTRVAPHQGAVITTQGSFSMQVLMSNFGSISGMYAVI
ncbi:hypothetical protein N7527_009570 [Penicillium freii]|nr:hypothetical protein N7527_009570 [Penicillium freii]